MAAFMSQDPNTGTEQALNEAVQHPSRHADIGILNHGDVAQGSPGQAKCHGQISDHIVHGCSH